MSSASSAAKDPVFIIGTGRSGTHWLADCLANSPELRVEFEVVPRFQWSRMLALAPHRRRPLMLPLRTSYWWARRRAAPKRLVDKAHPNIWHAEALLAAFPGACFLGIQREVHATVASMMSHPQVRAWHERWREFPVPNGFLGITPWNAARYGQLSLPEQCTLRWLAHRDRMRDLVGVLGERLLVVEYQAMMDDVVATMDLVTRFIGVPPLPAVSPVRTESREKWRRVLTDADVERMAKLIAEWDIHTRRESTHG